jgi:hypothetical protein
VRKILDTTAPTPQGTAKTDITWLLQNVRKILDTTLSRHWGPAMTCENEFRLSWARGGVKPPPREQFHRDIALKFAT